MMLLISALAFVLLLTLLIIIHELGHFTLAKLFKIDVEEFGFGLPPKAKSLFRSGGTEFTLNWVPFGGFVRLKGENEVNVEKRFEPGSFASAPYHARILILGGGVFMNFMLAFVLLVIGFWVGEWVPNHYTTDTQFEVAAAQGEIIFQKGVFVQEILKDGAADKAGLQKGASILAVDGKTVTTPEDVLALQKDKETVQYTVEEGKARVRRTIDLTLTEGKAGVALAPTLVSATKRSFGRAVTLALNETTFMTVQTVIGMYHLGKSLLTEFAVPAGITGVVGIYALTYASVQDGFATYMQLVALLSLSLAILNILPLPALDGGRLMFVFIEMIIRRPLNQQFELLVNAAGFFLLIALIVIITFNDVIHLF